MRWLAFRMAYHTGKESLEKQRWEKAEISLKQSLLQIPFHPDATLALAQALWGLGKKEEARSHLSEFLSRQGNFAPAFVLEGRWLCEEKKVEQASKELEKAVSVDPKNIEAWYELGRIYVQLDLQADAFRAFKKVAYADPFIAPFELSLLEEKLQNAGNPNA